MARILLVDDDASVVRALKAYLEAKGHEVRAAFDGYEAAEAARRTPPDLIVSDITMPKVDGTTAHSVLKRDEATSRIPVIFVTGLPRENAEKIVPHAPDVRLLPKPVNLVELERAIEALLPPKKGS